MGKKGEETTREKKKTMDAIARKEPDSWIEESGGKEEAQVGVKTNRGTGASAPGNTKKRKNVREKVQCGSAGRGEVQVEINHDHWVKG